MQEEGWEDLPLPSDCWDGAEGNIDAQIFQVNDVQAVGMPIDPLPGHTIRDIGQLLGYQLHEVTVGGCVHVPHSQHHQDHYGNAHSVHHAYREHQENQDHPVLNRAQEGNVSRQ